MQRGLLPWVLCAGLLACLPFQPVLSQSGGTAGLSLDHCLRVALENNLDLVAARKDPAIAEQAISARKAALDGTLSAGLSYFESDGDQTFSSVEATSESDSLGGSVSFTDPLSIGGNYSLSYALNDATASGTQIVGASLTSDISDSQLSRLTLDYTLPLLNGLGKEVNTVDILVALGNLEISRRVTRFSEIFEY